MASEGFFSFIGKAIKGVAGLLGIGGSSSSSSSSSEQLAALNTKIELNTAVDTKQSTFLWILAAGLAIVVVLVLIVMFRRRRK
jgi:hypothetical protein